MSFYSQYPPSASSSSPSTGTNGAVAPAASTQAGAIDPSGNLQALKVDAAGNLLVDISSPVTLSENIAQFGGNNVVTGTGASGLGIPRVTVANDSSVIVSAIPAIPAGTNTIGNINNIAGTISLPTGAATDSTLVAMSALLANSDSTLTAISSQFPPQLGPQITNYSTAVNIAYDQIVPISASALPLPIGAATSADQVTGNTSLSSIATQTSHLPSALGQTTMANSLPITIASDQNALPVSISSSSLPTGAATDANQTNVQSAPGTPQTVALTIQGNASGVAVPVSASALPLPTGAATSANQSTGNTSLASIDTKLTSPLAVTGTFFQATQPVSATSLPLPTGAATSALQTTISGQLPSSLGAKTTANSLAVNIASDQSLPVTPAKGTLTDRSGTTSGTPSTSTTAIASNASRKYLIIQNTSTTATLWVNFTSAATAGQPSIQLLPGGSFVQESSFVTTEAVTVLSTVASSPFAAKEA